VRQWTRARWVGVVVGSWLLAVAVPVIVGAPASALVGADPSIEASASPDPVEVGDDLEVTLSMRNERSSGADNVTVIDVLPLTVVLDDVDTTAGSCSGATTVQCDLGSLVPGQTATITLHMTPTTAGQAVNAATVSALLDTDLLDNSAVTTIEVVPADGGGILADLALTMAVAPDPGAVGVPLAYAITVINAGPDTAEGVVLVDALPPGVSSGPVSTSQGSCSGTVVVTCSLGALSSGSNAAITIGVVPTAVGVVTNSAVVSGSTVDPDPTDNQATKTTTIGAAGTGLADIALAMDVAPDPGAIGSALTYTMRVTNAGPDAAAGVTFVDTLPAGVSLDQVTASQGSCNGIAVVTCSIGTLPSGSHATVTMAVVPNVEGAVTNSAFVASSTLDPNPLNNQALRTTMIAGAGAGGCTINGTEEDDVLRGTPGKDVFCGLGGADRLIGFGGRDLLRGGPGDDVLTGGGGNDRVKGGGGDDALKGSGGNDVLKGGPGRDRFSGGAGRDRCASGPNEATRGCE
jgi:uncharacterized repeat protein (TIGR01451 family)